MGEEGEQAKLDGRVRKEGEREAKTTVRKKQRPLHHSLIPPLSRESKKVGEEGE